MKKYIWILLIISIFKDKQTFCMEEIYEVDDNINIIIDKMGKYLKTKQKEFKTLRDLSFEAVIKIIFEKSNFNGKTNLLNLLNQDLQTKLFLEIIKKYPTTYWNCFNSYITISDREQICELNSLDLQVKDILDNYFSLDLSFNFYQTEDKIVINKLDDITVHINFYTTKEMHLLNEKILFDSLMINLLSPSYNFAFLHKKCNEIILLKFDENFKISKKTYSLNLQTELTLQEIIITQLLENNRIEFSDRLELPENLSEKIRMLLVNKYSLNCNKQN